MAVLAYEKQELEIVYASYKGGWVGYQIRFLWDKEPLINDKLLKREGEYWNSRPFGTFIAEEYEEDTLLPLIREALDFDRTIIWEPTDPDVVVNISPPSAPLKPSWESEDRRLEREAKEKMKTELGKLPDDYFDFRIMIDAYNLRNADHYHGGGIALHMTVERQTLEEFYFNLKLEYEIFLKKHPVCKN